MRPLMTVTVCAAAKAFIAVHAFEDFLVEMRPEVNFQTIIRFCPENAQMASKWAIVRMSKSYMSSKIRCIVELVAAL